MEITNIKLENYKGVSHLDSKVFPKTMVSGKNASGKTTVADAIFDIMCDKMSDGTSPNNIRPHDDNGYVMHNVPVIREIVANINGNTYTICKKTEEKWRKPHGSTELVYDGSKTTFSIDGFEKQLKDYTEWMTDHVAKPEMVSFYMNPQVFINTLRKSTTEARKLLEKVSGFSVNDFVSKNEKYQEVARLIGENSIEDVLKQYRRNLRNQKDALDKAKSNLEYEKSREIRLIAIDEEQETMLKDRYEELSKELSKANEALKLWNEKREELKEQLAALTSEKASFEHGNDIETIQKKNQYEMSRLKAISSANTAKAKIAEAQSFVSAQNANIVTETSKINRYKEEQEQKTCPMCGQMLPTSKAGSIANKYTAEIEKLTFSIQKRQEAIAEKEDEIKNLESSLPDITAQYNEAVEAIKAIDEEAKNRKWEHDDAIEAIKQEISEVEHRELRQPAEIRQELELAERGLSKIESDRNTNNMLRSENERLVSELSGKVKEEAGACAEIERKIDLVQEFSIEKNHALAEKINPYFNHFYFKFIEYTELEHNPVETCRMIEKETCTDYMNGLNHGSKIVCEAELVSGFQRLNGVSLPVILDDSESIDTDKIPNLEQQTLVLRRVDDEPLTIREMK